MDFLIISINIYFSLVRYSIQQKTILVPLSRAIKSLTSVLFRVFFVPDDANDAKVPKVQIAQNWQNCKKRQNFMNENQHLSQFYQSSDICTIGTEKNQLNIYFFINQCLVAAKQAYLKESICRNFSGKLIMFRAAFDEFYGCISTDTLEPQMATGKLSRYHGEAN